MKQKLQHYKFYLFIFVVFALQFFNPLVWDHWLSILFIFVSMLSIGVVLFFQLLFQQKQISDHGETIRLRLKKAGDLLCSDLPVGILLYNEKKMIEWVNPFVTKLVGKDQLIGQSISAVSTGLFILKQSGMQTLTFGKKKIEATVDVHERIVYFQDVSKIHELNENYEKSRVVFGLVLMDNIDEITKKMDEQTRLVILSKLSGIISDWASLYHVFLKRIHSDRFLVIMTRETLDRLIQNKFQILEDVRVKSDEMNQPFTLSIGISAGVDDFMELGKIAQEQLDIAVGRGGNQVIVKDGEEFLYFGGSRKQQEKTGKLRTRLNAEAIRKWMLQSDQIFIMGHRIPDMDVIGSAFGLLQFARHLNKPAYIILEGLNTSIEKMMEYLLKNKEYSSYLLSFEQAKLMMKSNTLTILVDTHNLDYVVNPDIFKEATSTIIIDHHFLTHEDVKMESSLFYHEVHTSSTSELVAEMIPYFDRDFEPTPSIATALLAGVMVDSKNFRVSVTARTFETLAMLKKKGADAALITQMFSEPLDDMVLQSEIMRNSKFLFDRIVLADAPDQNVYHQVLIAQVADKLLLANGVHASFVVSRRPDGMVTISSRSDGTVNISIAMEKLGGGGDLSKAGAQLPGTVATVVEQLKKVLNDMNENKELFK
jgi:c-di-AMP phosphodiesterase-like protein